MNPFPIAFDRRVRRSRITMVAFLTLLACAAAPRRPSDDISVSVLQPCATRVIVRNETADAHELSWADRASGTVVRKPIPARTAQFSPYVSVVERVPAGVRVSVDGVASRYESSTAECVAGLPVHPPDSLPSDYGTLNALVSSVAGARFPGIVMVSFERTVTRSGRDSIVLAEGLELVGGVRIGEEGLGIWIFWTPDDQNASRARTLADRLSRIPGIRSASLTGLSGAR